MKLMFAALLLTLAGCSQAGGTGTAPAGTAAPSPATAASAAPSAAPSATTDSPAPAGAQAVTVLDFKIDPATVTVKGTTVTLAVTNDGPTVHNVIVRDDAGTILLGTKDLRPGESETISGEIPAGSYVMFCSLPGHESLGTKGTLEVSAP